MLGLLASAACTAAARLLPATWLAVMPATWLAVMPQLPALLAALLLAALLASCCAYAAICANSSVP